jgi:hypothetical protein
MTHQTKAPYYCKSCGSYEVAQVKVPEPPKGSITPSDFADYIWFLHGILNRDAPDVGSGLEPERSQATNVLSCFASFLSCAAEDGLWKEDEDGKMGNGHETAYGVMRGVYELVLRDVQTELNLHG